MSRHPIGCLAERLIESVTYGENRGLRVRCEPKLFLRTLKTKLRQRKTEGGVCAFEDITSAGISLMGVLAHADFLASLTGENKGDSIHGGKLIQ